MRIVIIIFLSFLFVDAYSQRRNIETVPDASAAQMINAINHIRSQGCKCGRKKMAPVAPVNWNDKLYASASIYAKEMYKTGRFAHTSRNGDNIGIRLDRQDYFWQFSGENIGKGQLNFKQALEDWMASKTHCEMIMNPKMKDMAIARYGEYWVQHFGAKMPANAERGRMKYREN